MTIKIGETHEVFSMGHQRWDGEDTPDHDATEAVKRLVEDHKDICCAMDDLMAENGGPAWAVEKLRESAAILAPFTDTDATLVDSGLRLCATPENEGGA